MFIRPQTFGNVDFWCDDLHYKVYEFVWTSEVSALALYEVTYSPMDNIHKGKIYPQVKNTS